MPRRRGRNRRRRNPSDDAFDPQLLDAIIRTFRPLFGLLTLALGMIIQIATDLETYTRQAPTHWTAAREQFSTLAQQAHRPSYMRALNAVLSLAPGTLTSYAISLRQWAEYCLNAGYAIADTHGLDAFLWTRAARGNSWGYIKILRSGISYFLSRFGRWDTAHITTTMAAIRRIFGAPKKKKKPITAAMIAELWQQTDTTRHQDLRNFTLIYTSWLAFLRNGEARHLKWSDTYFEDGLLVIRIAEAKTTLADQDVMVAIAPCPYHPVDPLRIWLDWQHEIQAKRPDCPYVFPGQRDDKPMSYQNCLIIFKDAAAKLGLDHTNFGTHSARIGGVTTALKHRVPPELVGKHGRWATAQWYSYYYDPRFNNQQLTEALVAAVPL